MIKMEYCLNDNEYLIHINDIVKGSSSPYKCICHQEKVIAKKGDIVQHHFAHAASTDNEYLYFENLVKIKETLLHKKAKEIIKSWKEIKVKPETKFNHNEFVYLKLINNDDLEIKNDLYGKSYIFNIIDVKIEKKIQNVSIIPDITLICSFGEKIFNLHIEIEVFHKVGDEKFQILKENKINCLEIKITDLYNLNTLKITDEYFDTNAFLKIIEEALLNIQNHRWLYFDENIVYCEEEVKERNEKIKNIFRQKNFELLEERKRRMENYFSPEIWESKWQKYFYLFISREEEEENFQNVAKHCFLASNQFFKFMCAGLLFECSKISGTRYEIRNNDKNIYLNLEYDQSLVAEKSFMLNDLNKEVNSSKYYLFSVHVSNKVYSYIKKQIVDFENISKLKHLKDKEKKELEEAKNKIKQRKEKETCFNKFMHFNNECIFCNELLKDHSHKDILNSSCDFFNLSSEEIENRYKSLQAEKLKVKQRKEKELLLRRYMCFNNQCIYCNEILDGKSHKNILHNQCDFFYLGEDRIKEKYHIWKEEKIKQEKKNTRELLENKLLLFISIDQKKCVHCNTTLFNKRHQNILESTCEIFNKSEVEIIKIFNDKQNELKKINEYNKYLQKNKLKINEDFKNEMVVFKISDFLDNKSHSLYDSDFLNIVIKLNINKNGNFFIFKRKEKDISQLIKDTYLKDKNKNILIDLFEDDFRLEFKNLCEKYEKEKNFKIKKENILRIFNIKNKELKCSYDSFDYFIKNDELYIFTETDLGKIIPEYKDIKSITIFRGVCALINKDVLNSLNKVNYVSEDISLVASVDLELFLMARKEQSQELLFEFFEKLKEIELA